MSMQKPFNPRNLSERVVGSLNDFLNHNDFAELYKSYRWEDDNHKTGFTDIMSLEIQLRHNAKTTGMTCDDIRRVVKWGKLRNPGRVKCIDSPALPVDALYSSDGKPIRALEMNPTSPIEMLDQKTTGLGPTYLSKALRFAMPEQYGAIDTWCVRVFGEGDPENSRHNWLALRTRNDGYGWYISKAQSSWPSEYGTWINILRYFAHRLPANCPHPPAFVEKGLREKGKWTCADVEMALFTYAYGGNAIKTFDES